MLRKRPVSSESDLTDRKEESSGRLIDRRSFIQVTGLGLVGSTLACASSESTGTARGTLRIIVQGRAAGSDVGQARVRTLSGADVTMLSLGQSATSEHSLPVGSYQVSIQPPPGATVSAGSSETSQVIIAAGATAEVTFQLTVASALIFRSDWNTALGTSNAAILDTSSATPWSFRGAGCEVVPSTGLDLPTPNCLMVPWGNNSIFNFVRKTSLGLPAIGGSRYYRWYMRVHWPDGTADPSTHPMQDGFDGTSINWVLQVDQAPASPGMWQMNLWVGTNVAYPNRRYFARLKLLEKRKTYRFELQVHRVTASTFRLHVRVYDSAGNQVLSDADFLREDSSTVSLANNPTFEFFNINNLDGFNAGCNDTGLNSEAGVFAYQAAVAISDTDWIGPYSG